MPRIIQHIDQIARQKQRDVLSIIFGVGTDITEDFVDWSETAIWQEVTGWLDEQGIQWYPCGGMASENCLESYRGQIYVDIPYDAENADYRRLRDYFENPDGTMRISGVTLCYLSLNVAMRNAHHDEPGFWEKWAKDF
ncbi:hypothetical protein JL101_029610 (plasmid) [Skermanella rosea]|uniref:hypothetical protein n=1 Tax=Skermanella rosea TaxID=1817965 RepID=UPI001933B13E|nr:hypothetical protein [Skermanella rosea]UEM07155.1 hypothetical protein JL101_029610 [Skermanella rosea]